MKREILVLNVVCLLLALAFLGFALYNALTADSFASFLTMDNLFTTAFCLLMATAFISIPASWLVTTGVVKIPFIQSRDSSGTTPARSQASLPAGAATPAITGPASAAKALPASREVQRDAKGRPIPPDVQSMVSEMNKSQQKTS